MSAASKASLGKVKIAPQHLRLVSALYWWGTAGRTASELAATPVLADIAAHKRLPEMERLGMVRRVRKDNDVPLTRQFRGRKAQVWEFVSFKPAV